jgi:hypothetical protein
MQGEHVEDIEAVSRLACGLNEHAGLVRGERLDLRLRRSRSLHAGGAALYQTITHGLRERLVERYLVLVDRARGEPAIELLAIQGANVSRSERLPLQTPEGRLDMDQGYSIVTLVSPLPHGVSHAVGEPAVEVLPHR